MAAYVERRAACGASYNACASGATPCKFETRQPARPAGKRWRTVNFNAELGGGSQYGRYMLNDAMFKLLATTRCEVVQQHAPMAKIKRYVIHALRQKQHILV